MRVLVVEDHVEIAETVASVLRREGMAVDLAFEGRTALVNAAVHGYDVIVLDRDLPELHGDEVCRTLVERGGQARVLMLTASARSPTASRGSDSAPTTTWSSRSRSPS